MFLAVKIRGKGPPKYLTEFYKSRSPSTMLQCSVTIGQATWDIRRQKKKKERKKIETLTAKQNGRRPAAAGGRP